MVQNLKQEGKKIKDEIKNLEIKPEVKTEHKMNLSKIKIMQ